MPSILSNPLPTVSDIETLLGTAFSLSDAALINRVLPAVASLLAARQDQADAEIDKILKVLTAIRVLDGLTIRFSREPIQIQTVTSEQPAR